MSPNPTQLQRLSTPSGVHTVQLESWSPVQRLADSPVSTGSRIDEWNRYLAVNLTGTFLCMQNALADMVGAEWGRIVTISSAAGQNGASRQGHYSATKGGVIALTKSVALDYAAKGITVNTVPPFVVDTPMLREQQRDNKLPPAEFLTKAIPAGRLGTGEDIAALCGFLCSDAASYITGQVIGVNGGAVI